MLYIAVYLSVRVLSFVLTCCCHTVRSYRTVYSVPYGISTLQNEKMISGDLSPFQKLCTQTSLTF